MPVRELMELLDAEATSRAQLLEDLIALRANMPPPSTDATSFNQRQNLYHVFGAFLMRAGRLDALINELRQPEKRPVAWRVKDFADGWILFRDEAAAWHEAEKTNALMQGLYVRDGS